ncbi:MAG: cysteine desulfurase family protein [Motilibacteraceae bacterium]
MAYLDAASAQPPHPAARAAWAATLERGWADPSRLHPEGRRAAALLDAARAGVAHALGAHPDEVSFTSSGTTAVHTGLLGLLTAAARRDGEPGRVVVSAVEHSAVLRAADAHAAAGGEVSVVPVDRTGRVDVEEFLAAVAGQDGARAAAACLQSGNHEVGTLQPVAEVAAGCGRLGVPLLVDAAQSVGRMPVPAGWSVLAASAHKWGGPPGVGVLVVRRPVRWRSPWPEDEREAGRFPGAPPLPAALGAASALESIRADPAAEAGESARLSALVERIRTEVTRRVPDVEVVGHPDLRLPHIVTFSCLYVDGEALVTGLARAGHSVSSGSSCTSSTLRPSHVLEAMGVLTHGNVRVSLPYGTSGADVDAFLEDLPRVVAEVRSAAGVAGL